MLLTLVIRRYLLILIKKIDFNTKFPSVIMGWLLVFDHVLKI